MKFIISGGTGFIGKRLIEELSLQGHESVLLTRSQNAPALPSRARAVAWDGRTTDGWAAEMEVADAVVHLAGDPVAEGRWTENKKGRIRASRIEGTRAVIDAIKSAKRKPRVMVSASAVGFYGDVPDGEVSETSAQGSDFLAGVCAAWEAEALKAESLGVRTVVLRIGVVIDKNGGALSKIALPFKFFAGGYLGTGRQWFPWIHRDDVVGLIRHAVDHPSLRGPVNAVAPEPATLREFCRELGSAMGRPSWAHPPAFVLRLALGEMAEMLLGGQMAVPKKALDSGYLFRHPTMTGAMSAVVK